MTMTYLEYLNQVLNNLMVEKGCPFRKCKFHDPVPFIKLREHLVNDCTKINLQCNICLEKFRRPFAPYHECISVFKRQVGDYSKQLMSKENEIKMTKEQKEEAEKML